MFGGYYGYGLFDPTMILVLIGAVLSMWASAKVQGTFNKYSSVRSRTGMTGADAARRLLNSQGIYDVSIEGVAGNLTDHYDPRSKTLRLSESVYQSSSVSAIGVAAHECGHAIQDHVGYVPLRMRAAFVPVVNFGSHLSWPLILIGVIIGGIGSPMVNIGIWMFVLVVLFQLITLPVELNASRRAVVLLDQNGILQGEEVSQTRKVLGAAALTYVAAAASSILQLLRLVILFGGRRDRD
jgi:Zn-dependent membrane protease YugP